MEQAPQQSRPAISIGMPVFNCAGTVAQAISSILNQTLADWELLIIDDGSTDNTVEIAASFDDPRIIVTRGGENKRLPTRLNECVNRARGRYFARMDGDDIAYPGRLKCQLEFLQSHPDVDLVAGWMVAFRGEGAAFSLRRGPLTHELICARTWKGITMAHPTWMGKVEWFCRNQYRPDAVLMEDRELLFRTYRNSKFASVPEIVLGYRENSLSLSKILIARKFICKALIRDAREQRRFAGAAVGVIGQATVALLETIAICTGLNYHLLRHRVEAMDQQQEREWRSVWEQVMATADRLLADHECLPDISQGTAI